MLLVVNDSKYKMCPKCGLSNNPENYIQIQGIVTRTGIINQSINGCRLRCRVCGYTTKEIDCLHADTQWNFTGLNRNDLIWYDNVHLNERA